MSTLKRIRKECSNTVLCNNCVLHCDDGCLVGPPPELWNVKEIKKRIKSTRKKK